MNNYNELVDACAEFSLALDSSAVERLQKYAELLVEWNKKINLTAITEPSEIITKHFYDCLLLFKHFEFRENASIIDVGTGAGFPGMVLKIARPDLKITLLDGLQKRLNFLNKVANELKLDVVLMHDRAEDAGKKPELRENFDFSTARAVARLQILGEYCIPFVKRGGSFISMKGPAAADELVAAQNALKLLGGDKGNIITETLPDNSTRAFVEIKKVKNTPPIYPRHGSKISKKPL